MSTTETASVEATTSFVGAFPTDFTVPDSCTALSANGIIGYDFASTCLPSSFDAASSAYYSPGTACPSGYTAQDSCTRSSGTTSVVTCCPVRSDITMSCVPDPAVLEGPWEEMFCTWSAGDKETVLLVTVDEDSTLANTMTGPDGINAYGLRMVYEPTDTETTSSTTASSKAGSSVASATATASDDSSEDEPNPAAHDEGLSTGAKAAIGVVVPIVVIALVAGLFIWFRRRKQRQAGATEMSGDPKELVGSTGVPATDSGSPGNSYGPSQPPQPDTSGASSYQAYGAAYQPPQEMPGDSYVSELPADTRLAPGTPASHPTVPHSVSPNTTHSTPAHASAQGHGGFGDTQPPTAGYGWPHQ